jgi:L-alanine-DL-glutamate epimerase-like enolase superfamily enzyme
VKITRVAVYSLTLPLEKPYRLSGGRLLFEALDATFIRIDTDSGLTGWGEGTPWGHSYLPAFGGGIRAAAAILAPAILGLDPRRIGHIEHAMDTALPGHLYAKAPFDIACWDLAGQSAGLPIADLLGGRYDEPTPIASSVPTDTPDGMLATVTAYRGRGYWVHSAKLGDGVDADIARIRHLEANRQPDETIIYDVNRAWTRDQAITVMNAVADLPGLVFEQPCETLDDCRAVRRLTRAPISIDERLETLHDMQRIVGDGIGEIVNIKIGRVGGLTKARRLRDMAVANSMRVLVMATGGSVVADSDAAHLAQSTPRENLIATWACQDMLTVDPAPPDQGARNVEGAAAAPDLPGLGVAPIEDRLGDPVAVYGEGA